MTHQAKQARRPRRLRRAVLGAAATAVLLLVPAALADAHAMSLSPGSYTVPESVGVVHVNIHRTGSGTSPYVDFDTSDGTALAGLDYANVHQHVVFGPSDSDLTVDVPIADDALIEGDETINMVLSGAGPPGDGHLGTPSTGTITILDDDSEVRFSASAYQAQENDDRATITVQRSGIASGTDTVAYASSDGSATAGQDYAAVSGTLQFAPGQTSRTFDVPLQDDGFFEGPETVNLALTDPSRPSLHLADPSQAVLTIADNDEPPTDEPPTDIVPTLLEVRAPRVQDAGQGAVVMTATCDRACDVRGSGTVVVSGGVHARTAASAGLRHARRSLAGAGSAELRLGFSPRARRLVRRALKRHRRVTARATVVARDRAGHVRKVTRRIRIRR